MVRLSLSFLSIATAFAAVASAAPFVQQSFEKIATDPLCLPGTSIKEYQSFELLSLELDTYVSRKIDSGRLVGGINGEKSMQKLEFCIVSNDRHHCDSMWGTNCVLENVDYRIRVKGYGQAFLRVDGHYVRIVHSFEDASLLSLSNDNGLGVRIAHQYEDDEDKYVFATSSAFEEGKPIVLESLQKDRKRQRFEIVESRRATKKISFDDKLCVPEVDIREYHPFQLKSSNLDSLLSKHIKSNLLVGGFKNGNKNFEKLEFCIVSSDYGCSTTIPSSCIYQNVEYRFRVNGPVQGYLSIEDEQLRIVPDFEDASGLNLYKEEGWGLRIAHLKKDGSRSVFETTSPGRAVILTEFEKDNSRQWFQIIEANSKEHSRW